MSVINARNTLSWQPPAFVYSFNNKRFPFGVNYLWIKRTRQKNIKRVIYFDKNPYVQALVYCTDVILMYEYMVYLFVYYCTVLYVSIFGQFGVYTVHTVHCRLHIALPQLTPNMP